VLSQYAGVSMSWSIFDGFATRAAKISAKANIRQYERQLQTATDQVLDQAVGLERQAGFAYRSMNLAQSRADISASALKAVQEDAKSGAASRIAVEAAQAVSNQYQITLQSQRADLLSRWAEFVSIIGRDPVVAKASALANAR
jgi:outer membrane protein TolC